MVDETKLLDMSEEQLLEVLQSHSPTNVIWEGAKAALEVKNTKRMVQSARRMEWATYGILLAAVVQIIIAVVPCFRH